MQPTHEVAAPPDMPGVAGVSAQAALDALEVLCFESQTSEASSSLLICVMLDSSSKPKTQISPVLVEQKRSGRHWVKMVCSWPAPQCAPPPSST